MKFIAHRINTVKELINIPTKFGIEIDLRDYKGEIILNHEPFEKGDFLEDFLSNYQHNTLILNIKSESIEYKILDLLKKYNIINYFFLDSSFPMIFKFMEMKIKDFAIRVSEFEDINTAVRCAGLSNWVWIDCLSKPFLDIKSLKYLKSLNYRICLVGPDLLKRDEEIALYKNFLKENNFIVEAVCTKIHNINHWID